MFVRNDSKTFLFCTSKYVHLSSSHRQLGCSLQMLTSPSRFLQMPQELQVSDRYIPKRPGELDRGGSSVGGAEGRSANVA